VDRYATKSWQSLQALHILSREEAEEKADRAVLAILAEIEDSPTCNDEIWELLENDLEEVAMGLHGYV
jgi:hypothetical protein